MIYPSEDQWAKWGISRKHHRMFVLHLDELFSDETPDTWQVRTCNLRTALDELISTADLATSFEPARHSLTVLISEMRGMVQIDPVLARRFPNANDCVKALPAGEIKAEQIVPIMISARVLSTYIGNYRETLIAECRALLAGDQKENKKGDLYRLTVALATEFATEGYSSSYLREVIGTLLHPPETPFIDRFDQMILLLSGKAKEYHCRIGAGFPTYASEPSLAKNGITLARGKPDGTLSLEEERFYRGASEHDVFLDIRVEALDRYSAARNADEKLSNMFAIRQLFQTNKQPARKGNTALIADGHTAAKLVRFPKSRFRASEGSENDITAFFDLESRLHGEDRSQLTAAAQYHRLAMTATTDEARLVNLWIAMESLARRGQHGSIIERVCTNVTPTVACGNVAKYVHSVLRYIEPLWLAAFNPALLEHFPHSSNAGLAPQDVLLSLIEPDNGPRSKAIYRMLKDHPLLIFRFFRLRKGPFSSAAEMLTMLTRHRQTVEWQIRRIYRARNSVAHEGVAPATIRFLLQHLHTYFITAVRNLISDLHLHAEWTLTEALAHRRIMFEQLLRCHGTDSSVTPSIEVLLDPSCLFGPLADHHPAWPSASKS